MARPSNTAERRSQITSGLARVMAKRGYDGASVADVAKAAKLTPGLVHYHFKSKQEILLELLNELGERHLAGLDARLRDRSTCGPAAQLDALIDFHLGLGDADPEALACWILLSGEALREAKVRQRFESVLAEIVHRVERVLEAGVESGAFGCLQVNAVASGLVATIQGYYVMAATARALIPRGTAAATTKAMVRGLTGAVA